MPINHDPNCDKWKVKINSALRHMTVVSKEVVLLLVKNRTTFLAWLGRNRHIF
jgi:hypothetical protein